MMEKEPASQTMFNFRTFQTTRYEDVKIFNGLKLQNTRYLLEA
jgi:hypothetical protein